MGHFYFCSILTTLPELVTYTARLFADDCLLSERYVKRRTPSYFKETLIICNNGTTPGFNMQFNPDKCEVLRVTNKRKPIAKNYTIHGKTLELVKNAKYLGLNISHNLSWNHHIGTVTKKVNNINAFLSRNISSCPNKIKTQCYTTLS